jgi:hypothetical protein
VVIFIWFDTIEPFRLSYMYFSLEVVDIFVRRIYTFNKNVLKCDVLTEVLLWVEWCLMKELVLLVTILRVLLYK